jgi:carbon starvation protein CstA
MFRDLRMLRWVGVACEAVALALMFCHLFFGLWPQNWWYVAAVLLLQLCFIAAQTTAVRRNRAQRER